MEKRKIKKSRKSISLRNYPGNKVYKKFKFVSAEYPPETADCPIFVIVYYSINGKREELGLRLDLGKRTLLDYPKIHIKLSNDQEIELAHYVGQKIEEKLLSEQIEKVLLKKSGTLSRSIAREMIKNQ